MRYVGHSDSLVFKYNRVEGDPDWVNQIFVDLDGRASVSVNLSAERYEVMVLSPVILIKSNEELPEYLDLIILRLLKHVEYVAFHLLNKSAIVTTQPMRFGRVLLGRGYLACCQVM